MPKPKTLYWATMISWDFGSWKTFGLWAELYQQKKDNPDICLIANLPRSITDIYYNSMADFTKIIDYLYRFYAETNSDLKWYDSKWKDIIVVLDEAQRYFPARGFKENKELWEKLTIVLTQCRKRYTKFRFATQRTKMVDLNFRRLADYIRFYRKDSIFVFKLSRLNVFQCWWGISDLLGEDWITWETIEDLKESQVYNGLCNHNTDILDSILKIKNPKRGLRDEKHITQHICWLFGDYFQMDYEEFKKNLMVNQHSEYAISLYNEDWIPLMGIWEKIVDDYWVCLNILSSSLDYKFR